MADTADMGAKIAKAKQAGYSDDEIADFLARDTALAPKIATARKAGYGSTEIVGHLSGGRAHSKERATMNPVEVVIAAGARAKDKLVRGVRDDYKASVGRVTQPTSNANVLAGEVDRLKRTGRFVGDVAELVTSPVAGLMHEYVTGPGANALAKVVPIYRPTTAGEVVEGFRTGKASAPRRLSEEEARTKIEGDLNAAIGTAMPGRGAVGFVGPRVPQGLKTAGRVAPASIRTNRYVEGVRKFDQANVEPSVAAIRRGPTTTVANAVAENPLAGMRARNQMDRQIAQVGTEADRIARGYGVSRGRQMTGEAVQDGVQRFNGNRMTPPPSSTTAPTKQSSFSAKADALYDEAFAPIEVAEEQAVARAAQDFETRTANVRQQRDAQFANEQASYEAAVAERSRRRSLGIPEGPEPVPPTEPALGSTAPQRPAITPTQTLGALRDIAQRVNGQRLSNLITDGKPRAILQALETDAHAVRFNDLRELRTWVRNAQRDPELRRSISDAGLQRIEAALTQDVYNNAERLAGPSALHRLRRADAYYRAGSERIKTALQAFDSARSGEQAYDRILQAASSKGGADIRKLAKLKRSLSADDWGDVASTVLTNMGRPSAGAANAVEEGAFSIDRFLTGFANMSDMGREVVFGARGGGGAESARLYHELENLAEVAGFVKDLKGGANMSKSAVAGQSVATGAGLVASPFTTIKVLSGLALTGEVLTNPRFVRMLANIGRTAQSDPSRVANMVQQFNQLTAQGRPRLASTIPTVTGDSAAVSQALERR